MRLFFPDLKEKKKKDCMFSIIYSIHFLLYFFFFSFKSGKKNLMMESYCLCHVQLSMTIVCMQLTFMVFNATTIFQLYRGSQILWLGLMLSCLKPLSTISQFYWWKKPKYQEKTTDKRYHIILYRVSSCQNRV